MKLLERFALTIFSLIVLLLSVAVICVMFEVLDAGTLITPVEYYLTENVTVYKVALGVCIVCILLAIKCLFFRSKKQDLSKDGIVLENSCGKLVISKESLENLVASVAKDIPGAEAVSSKTVLDKNRDLKVFVTTTVSRDMMIKEVSSDLQNKIKEAMKNTADLEVKEVNIKVKNITNRKVKKSKEQPLEQAVEQPEVEEVDTVTTEENNQPEINKQEGEE